MSQFVTSFEDPKVDTDTDKQFKGVYCKKVLDEMVRMGAGSRQNGDQSSLWW